MKTPLLLCAAVLGSFFVAAPTAEARPKHKHKHYEKHHRHHDRHDHYRERHRTRKLYIIERGRPVERVVYINPGGGYYRVINGRRVVVRERYYTSYPSRYYYPDGRRRVGIRFSF